MSREFILIFFLSLGRAAQCAFAKNPGADTCKNIRVTVYKCPYALDTKIPLSAAMQHVKGLQLVFEADLHC